MNFSSQSRQPRATILCGDTAYLSFGSNMGDSDKIIKTAAEALDKTGEIQVCRLSGFYRTEPVDMANGGWFVNCAAQITTILSPLELLDRLEEVEFSMGRTNKGLRKDRTLDIDILLYGGMVVSLPRLKIPHPEMAKRRFVLEPLTEIAPDIVHPILKKTPGELCAALEGQVVRRTRGK